MNSQGYDMNDKVKEFNKFLKDNKILFIKDNYNNMVALLERDLIEVEEALQMLDYQDLTIASEV